MEAEPERAASQPTPTTDGPSVVPNRPRRILQVACFYPPRRPLGGGTIVCSDLSKELRRTHEVEVFAGGINDPALLSTYELVDDEYEGVIVHRIILEYESFVRLAAEYWNPVINARFSHLLDRLSPDIVHFHSIQGLGAGLVLAAVERRIPTVVTVHDSWWLCARQFFLLWDGRTVCTGASLLKCALCITRGRTAANLTSRLTKPIVDLMLATSVVVRFFLLPQILAFANLLICPSYFLQRTYLSYGFNPVVSRNGIPSGLLDPKVRMPNSRIVFGFAGGTSLEKGFGAVMEATSKLNQRKFAVEIEVKIWGSCDARAVLTASEVRKVQFLGEVDRSRSMELLEGVDVLLFPSLLPENNPLTVLESLASGAPVVASRVGGIPEIVREGFNGFLVSAGSASELGECMIRLARNPGLITQMSQNALSTPPPTMKQQAIETDLLYSGLRSSESKIGLHLRFNMLLATGLFWVQAALARIWKARKPAWMTTLAAILALYKLDPAIRTPMTGGLSRNRIYKRMTCEIGCIIKEVRLFCDNLDGKPHTLTVSLCWRPNESPFAVGNVRISPRNRASWRSFSVDKRCEHDTVYIVIQSDSDRYGRVGYDLEEPFDQLYAHTDGVFRPQNARLWAKIITTAGVFGVDVAEGQPFPEKPSLLQDLIFSMTTLPILFGSYIAGRLVVPALTRMIRWKKRLTKRTGGV